MNLVIITGKHCLKFYGTVALTYFIPLWEWKKLAVFHYACSSILIITLPDFIVRH